MPGHATYTGEKKKSESNKQKNQNVQKVEKAQTWRYKIIFKIVGSVKEDVFLPPHFFLIILFFISDLKLKCAITSCSSFNFIFWS